MEQGRKTLGAAICIAIAFGLMAWVGSAPAALGLFAMFVPMLFVIAGVRTHLPVAAVGMVACGALIGLIYGWPIAVITLVCSAPAVFCMIVVQKKKMSLYASTVIGCISYLAGLLLLVWLCQMFFGKSLAQIMHESLTAFLTQNEVISKAYYYALTVVQSGDASMMAIATPMQVMQVPLEQAVNGLMRVIDPAIVPLLIQLSMLCVALFGFLNYIIPRAVLRKMGVDAGGNVPRFRDLALPKRFGTWTLVALLIAFIGVSMQWNNFDLVYSIMIGFLGIAYLIQGAAFFYFFLARKIPSRGGCVAIIILIAFVGMLFGLNLLMWLGFFEQIVKLRKRDEFRSET